MDYITATWKVGLGNKNDALVPSVLQCLCPKIVRQSKFRTNLAQLERNKRYHLRVLSIVAFGRAASEDWVCSPLPFSGRVLACKQGKNSDEVKEFSEGYACISCFRAVSRYVMQFVNKLSVSQPVEVFGEDS